MYSHIFIVVNKQHDRFGPDVLYIDKADISSVDFWLLKIMINERICMAYLMHKYCGHFIKWLHKSKIISWPVNCSMWKNKNKLSEIKTFHWCRQFSSVAGRRNIVDKFEGGNDLLRFERSRILAPRLQLRWVLRWSLLFQNQAQTCWHFM